MEPTDVEMTEIEKESKHKLLDSVGFTSLVVPVAFFFVRDLIAILLGFIIEMTAGKDSFLYEINDDIARLAISALLVFIMPLYFRGRCNFGFKGGYLKLGICLALPQLIVPVWNLLQIYVYKAPLVAVFAGVAAAIIHGIGPGVSEEIFCRGFGVSNLMRIEKDKPNRALRCALLSGVSFGLLHLTNIIATGDVAAALIQVVYTAAIGILYGAIYIRSRNLWGVILLHTLTDITAFIAVFDNNVSGMDIVFTVFGSVLFIAIALFLLRPAKQEAINELWAESWSFGEETEKSHAGAKTATIITVIISLLIAAGLGTTIFQSKMGYDIPFLPSSEKELNANINYEIGKDGRQLTILLPYSSGEAYELENSAPERLILKESGAAGGKYRFVFLCEGNSTEKISLKFAIKIADSPISLGEYSATVIFDEKGQISDVKG